MSFYSNGAPFSSSFSSPDSGRWDAQFSQSHQPLSSTPSHPPRFSNQDFVGLSQKLNHMVAIMTEQKIIIERGQQETVDLQQQVLELGHKVTDLQTSVQEMKQASLCTGTKRRKSIIPKSLSMFVISLHIKQNTEDQFKACESYRSPHNITVQESVLSDVTLTFDGVYSPARLKRSIYRYYESRRRLFNDDLPNRQDKALKTKMKSRRKANQKRLYLKHKKCLKGKVEMAKWADIGPCYMTEESGGEGEEIQQHALLWRSEELNKLVKKLDRRIAKSPQQGTIQPKKIIASTPSASEAPAV